jgi:hypothetical protein
LITSKSHGNIFGLGPVRAVTVSDLEVFMVRTALFVRLEAKPGKEHDVEQFLVGGLALVNEEPDTTAWFGIHLGPSTFGIFDAFLMRREDKPILRARLPRR